MLGRETLPNPSPDYYFSVGMSLVDAAGETNIATDNLSTVTRGTLCVIPGTM